MLIRRVKVWSTEELLDKPTVLPRQRGQEKVERKIASLLTPYLQFVVEAIRKRDYDRTAKILDIRTQLEIISSQPLRHQHHHSSRKALRESQSQLQSQSQSPSRKVSAFRGLSEAVELK